MPRTLLLAQTIFTAIILEKKHDFSKILLRLAKVYEYILFYIVR